MDKLADHYEIGKPKYTSSTWNSKRSCERGYSDEDQNANAGGVWTNGGFEMSRMEFLYQFAIAS